MRLPLVHPIPGLPDAIAQKRQHGPDAGILLAGASFRRGGRREHCAAQGAPQPLHFADRSLEEWLRHAANQTGWSFEPVAFGPQAVGTEVADFEGGMGPLYLPSARVILDSVSDGRTPKRGARLPDVADSARPLL